ncbi:hypothetical protein K438DRAFT_653330 [Mycena galopus ATCC 62051]|nr:hypothetical protein K438DRAFT_653330 [Mycena galopus ATCC 62051]
MRIRAWSWSLLCGNLVQKPRGYEAASRASNRLIRHTHPSFRPHVSTLSVAPNFLVFSAILCLLNSLKPQDQASTSKSMANQREPATFGHCAPSPTINLVRSTDVEEDFPQRRRRGSEAVLAPFRWIFLFLYFRDKARRGSKDVANIIRPKYGTAFETRTRDSRRSLAQNMAPTHREKIIGFSGGHVEHFETFFLLYPPRHLSRNRPWSKLSIEI